MHRASNPLNDDAEGQLLALRFGPFELDVRSGELRRNGTVAARLQPQPLKVLVLLAARPCEVVTREELQAEVWPAGTFVDFEQSLNFCIRQIRSALGDNANAPRYVETLPRRGYRWVGGAAERIGNGATVREWPRAVTAERPGAAPATAVAGSSSRLWLAGLALALAAVAGWRWLAPESPAAPPTFERITFRRGAVGSARFGPDGQVVYSAGLGRRASRPPCRGPDLGATSAPSTSRGPGRRRLDLRRGGVPRDGRPGPGPARGWPPKDVLKPRRRRRLGRRTAPSSRWCAGTGERFRDRVPGRPRPRGDAGPAEPPPRLSPDGRHLAIRVAPGPGRRPGPRRHPRPRGPPRRGHAGVGEPRRARVGAGRPRGWFTASEVGADNSLRALSLDGPRAPGPLRLGRLVAPRRGPRRAACCSSGRRCARRSSTAAPARPRTGTCRGSTSRRWRGSPRPGTSSSSTRAARAAGRATRPSCAARTARRPCASAPAGRSPCRPTGLGRSP